MESTALQSPGLREQAGSVQPASSARPHPACTQGRRPDLGCGEMEPVSPGWGLYNEFLSLSPLLVFVWACYSLFSTGYCLCGFRRRSRRRGYSTPSTSAAGPRKGAPRCCRGLSYITSEVHPGFSSPFAKRYLPTSLYGLCFYDLSSLYSHPVRRRLRLGTPISCAQTGPATGPSGKRANGVGGGHKMGGAGACLLLFGFYYSCTNPQASPAAVSFPVCCLSSDPQRGLPLGEVAW